MRSKMLVLAAVAAWLFVAVLPNAVLADVPIKKLNPPEENYFDSDPWVPDGRDPHGIIATPNQVSVEDTGVTDRQPAARSSWLNRVIWILRVLKAGGFVR